MKISDIPYIIGGKYKYRKSDTIFILKEVVVYRFIFECGHWCTDNIFVELIDIKKKVAVWYLIQTTIDFNIYLEGS